MTDATDLSEVSLLSARTPARDGRAFLPDAEDVAPGDGLPVTADQREAALAALRAAVRDGGDILLLAHVNPDADSLGSALALGLALRALGSAPLVSFDADPFQPPRNLRFLPGQEILRPASDVPPRPDLVVTLDAGSVTRLGVLGETVSRAGRVVVVDHHTSNTRFGHVNHIDPAAASTSVMVVELIDLLGVELGRDMAACLYAGLVTDTSSFRAAATTPAVHLLAARMLATGIRHDEISRSLWDTHRFGYVHLLGEILRRAQLEPAHDLVWSWCAWPDLRGAGIGFDEIEGAIDAVRVTAEAGIAVMCKQDADQVWKVSVRSKGRVDIGAVCTALGGGGHRFAAGFTSTGSLDATMTAFRDALRAAPRT